MLGILEGFGSVVLVIVLGAVLAHIGLLDDAARRVLTTVSFWVATPALLVGIVADSDLRRIFGADFLIHAIGVAAVGLVTVLVWVLVFKKGVADTTVGVLNATYTNTVNMGVPIATYALGDASAVVPLIVLQLVVMQPLALTILDVTTRTGRLTLRRLLHPLTNPLIIATAIGLVLSLTGWTLPAIVDAPRALVAQMAVPALLMAFGISLRLGDKPGADGGFAPALTAALLKVVALPAVVLAVAWGFGLTGQALLSVAVVAALPTAQNIYPLAAAYQRSENLTRDAIFFSTVLVVPAVLVLTWLLG